jgi:hypothetical protein
LHKKYKRKAKEQGKSYSKEKRKIAMTVATKQQIKRILRSKQPITQNQTMHLILRLTLIIGLINVDSDKSIISETQTKLIIKIEEILYDRGLYKMLFLMFQHPISTACLFQDVSVPISAA